MALCHGRVAATLGEIPPMNRYLLAVMLSALVFAAPAGAQPRTIDLEITHTHEGPVTVCVPLSSSKKDAERGEVMVDVLRTKLKPTVLGQLTAPSLLTEHIKPAAADQVRRDLYCTIF